MKSAFRSLLKSPGFAATAVLTLALGIGANTAIFSVINGVLLRPLPYDEPERLINVWESSQQQKFPKAPIPPGNFFDLRAQNSTCVALAAWAPASLNLSGDGIEAQRLDGVSVTSDLPAVLRVAPARGRFFVSEEFTPGSDGVVILSHALWQQCFGGDPVIVGRTLQLNGRPRIVVGILPEGFDYPRKGQAWLPYAPDAEFKSRRDWHQLRVVGRVKEGATVEQARADLQRINRNLAEQFPDTNKDWSINAYPMLDDVVRDSRPALLLLFAAVTALLLIACANVASLLLARAAARQPEIALRASLGASRGRIMRQLLGETLVLFAFGGGAGLLLARWGLDALLALAPPRIPRLDQVTIDPIVLTFTFVVALATGIISGLFPAWQATRIDLTQTLRQNSRSATAGRGSLRSALVVIQVAATVTLLVVSGLLIRSFDHVRRVPLGFKPERVLTFHVDLQSGRYNTQEKRVAFLNILVREVAALPGAISAGATTSVPLDGRPSYIMRFEGRPPVTPSNAPVASHCTVSSDLFRTLGITILRGRGFTEADAAGSPRVCAINETLAQKYFPHENPIGKRLEIGFDDPPAWREIVGIVADVKFDGLDHPTPVQVFEPLHQWEMSNYTIALRTTGDPAALGAMIRRVVQKLDPAQPVHTMKPMTRLVTESLESRTFSLVLLASFAAVALALAIIGLYGVVAYQVAQRTREFGIRLALGATTRDVIQLVLGEGIRLIVLGIAVGLFAALALGQFVQTLLFGVGPFDAATFAAIAVLLALVALIACLVPAWRAARVDPVIALRAE